MRTIYAVKWFGTYLYAIALSFSWFLKTVRKPLVIIAYQSTAHMAKLWIWSCDSHEYISDDIQIRKREHSGKRFCKTCCVFLGTWIFQKWNRYFCEYWLASRYFWAFLENLSLVATLKETRTDIGLCKRQRTRQELLLIIVLSITTFPPTQFHRYHSNGIIVYMIDDIGHGMHFLQYLQWDRQVL